MSEHRLPTEDFILVTPGGGGDGAELVDWVVERLRARSRPAAPRDPAAGAVHAGRAAAGVPGSASTATRRLHRDHLRGAGRAVLRARQRHRRAWAATTRSARSSPSASRLCWSRAPRRGSSSTCAPSVRSGSGSCACWPTMACGRRSGWPQPCASCRCMPVPRTSRAGADAARGWTGSARLIAPWLRPRGTLRELRRSRYA